MSVMSHDVATLWYEMTNMGINGMDQERYAHSASFFSRAAFRKRIKGGPYMNVCGIHIPDIYKYVPYYHIPQ